MHMIILRHNIHVYTLSYQADATEIPGQHSECVYTYIIGRMTLILKQTE